MKKLGISLLLIAAFAEAAPLPFIGKASFSFTGGSADQEYIIIKSTGDTEIGSCGMGACTVSYKGPFMEFIDVYGNGKTFYKFTAKRVTMLDEHKQVERSCNGMGIEIDEGLPCEQNLYFEEQEGTK